MSDAHEKFMDAAREAVENGRQEAIADGLFVGTVRALGMIDVYVAMALSQAHQDGIREGKRQAAEIALARLPLYATVDQHNAIRECVGSIISSTEDESQ